MVSTVVHISVGLIIACAILPSRNFTLRSLALVGVIVALLDADAFLFFISDGLHRTVFHNLIFPTIITAVILADVYRSDGFLSKYYDENVVVVLSVVCYISVLFAGIGLDYSDNGVNLFWPLHDQFYTLDGKFIISSDSGIVQTFIDSPFKVFAEEPNRTTESTFFKTPVSETSTSDSEEPIILWIAYNGWEMIMIILSIVTVSARYILERFVN